MEKGINTMEPLISVIVPVYNGEKFIDKCLDSLVYQTLENIEIIAVDNGSTDETLNILQQYERDYKNVHVYSIEHTQGPGGGRNKGFEVAKGKYIAFADADDYYAYNAMEVLSEYSLNHDCDILCYASYEIRGKDIRITRRLKNPTIERMLENGSMVFWNKLVKKDLYLSCGNTPEDFVFEDLAYNPVLISYAKKIDYIDAPLYYYIIRSDSSVNTQNSIRNMDSIKACKYALEHINPEYRDIFLGSVAKRIYDDITNRWVFADAYIEYLLSIQDELYECKYVVRDPYYKKIAPILRLSCPFEQNVIVNGFGLDDYNKFEEMAARVFWDLDNTRLVILNEKTCDINKNEFTREAYSDGYLDDLAQYFAVEYIYENGGIFIDNNIIVNTYFNCLRFSEVFLGYAGNGDISTHVFGGKKGNGLFLMLLNTYTDGTYYANRYLPINDRLKNILVLNYHAELTGSTCVTNNYVLLANNILEMDLGDGKNICSHRITSENSEDYVYIGKDVLKRMLEKAERDNGATLPSVLDTQKDINENAAKEIILTKRLFYDCNRKLGKINKKNTVTIVSSSSDFFVPYLSVLLQSIMEHASKENYYDIVILNKDITFVNMLKLHQMTNKYQNFSIRFYDMNQTIEKQNFIVREHFTIETYFRLFIPYVLSEYDRALHLDSDMVVTSDVSELFFANLNDKILGVTNDAIMVSSYNYKGSVQRKYMDESLKLVNPYGYFQAGSCLMDLRKYRNYISKEALINFITQDRWLYGDQDVLNLLFENKVKYFDMVWNYTVDVLEGRRTRLINQYAPESIKELYCRAKKVPRVIHYAGGEKPWNTFEVEFLDTFWKYAKKSPYYVELLDRMYNDDKSQGREEAVINNLITGENKKIADENKKIADENKKIADENKKITDENKKTKDKLKRYGIEINRLLICNNQLQEKVERLEKENEQLLLGISNYENAFFWKITLPFRKLLDLFNRKQGV